ncbi:MAG: Eco29kI family restriction endonuclease [Cohaesibacter sp.]|nr:Eco29kI family restriction endonuclease [Cohaesibacter sp.]
MKQQAESLPPDPFEGAGIYAIYYKGNFKPYCRLAARNEQELLAPIYIGKADPKGGRRGGEWDAPAGPALSDRLRKHANSISQARNLEIEDFVCRYLVLDDVWVRMAERMLISWYRPLWNVIVDGFGNNDPGKRRATQYRSPWDVMHPGRPWSEKLATGELTAKQIMAKIEDHLGS